MPQLLIPGAVQVTIKMECSGQDVVNVIGLSAGFAGNLGATLNAVKTAWEASNGPLSQKPSQLRMVEYRAVELSAAGPVATLSSTTPGQRTTQQLATMASSALINMGGGTRNRSQRGRLYHGPLTESDINTDGRTLVAGFQTSLQAAYNQFRTAMQNYGTPLVVISRKNASISEVTTLTVQSVIATQRRRQR